MSWPKNLNHWRAFDLVAADQIEGTAVYGADSQRIGSIERVMIDKISGKVAYAVLGFGGFLGIGDDHLAGRQDLVP